LEHEPAGGLGAGGWGVGVTSSRSARQVREDFFPRALVEPDEIHGMDSLLAGAVTLKFIPTPLTKEQVAE
jgi:hypothetical protein